jgi:hypothetical protein
MSTSSYCRHGSYIGDPYGPDYMCHACEMGYSDEEWEAERLWDLKRPILRTLFRQNKRLRWACEVLETCREEGSPLDAEQAAPLDRYARSTN